VALCNRVGPEECLTFAGESFVCGPDGRILARAPAGADTILYSDIDLGETARSHARRLFLANRRPELYGGWVAPGDERVSGSTAAGAGRPPGDQAICNLQSAICNVDQERGDPPACGLSTL
jgi:hypothetical protein